jgi:hypothetical protein
MKFYLTILLLFLYHVGLNAQVKLDVDGHVKIRGNIDISHPNDNTSIYIGRNSGDSTDIESQNFSTFMGVSAGKNNTSGNSNSFFGQASGFRNTTGNFNSFFGASTGSANTSGCCNTFLGIFAGAVNSVGSSNVFLGQASGFSNTTGTRNTFVGSNTDHLTNGDSLDRAVAIGYNAKVNCSHCAVIGGTGADAVKVGIGTDTPKRTLDVRGELFVKEVAGVAFFQSSTANSFISLENNSGIGAGANVGYFDDNTDNYFYVDIPGGAFGELVILSNGNVGIGKINPSHPLEMASGARVTSGGAWTNASSRSLKENIYDLTFEEAIATMAALNPVKFNYKLQKNEEYLGFVAEDVPELVATNDRKSLSPMDFVAILTKVVQDQEQRIKVLTEQVSNITILKNEMADLKVLLKKYIAQDAEED